MTRDTRAVRDEPRRVLCVETGEIFPSIRTAAKAAHRNHGNDIRDCCDGKRDNIDGLHYKWFEEEVKNEEMD